MRVLPLLVIALLAAPLAGCIQNVADLKDKLTGAKQDLQQASAQLNATSQQMHDALADAKPPVARITVFGANGALLFKSSFVGEDVTTPVPIEAGAALTLIGTDSEAIQGGATVASYAWSLAGVPAAGPRAGAAWNESGKYPVTLMVTDSNGKTDNQTVVLAIFPKPFDVVLNQTTGAIVGAMGAGQDADAKFDVKLSYAKRPAAVQAVTVSTPALDACDVVLTVTDKDGKAVGKSDKGGVGAGEAAVMGALPEGTYSVHVGIGDACVAKDGVVVKIAITFLPFLL
jgi:hypothetical protein